MVLYKFCIVLYCKVVSVHCAYCSGGSLFEVRDNLIRLQVWCSFLSTRVFLLGNGQTYAALGVPYYRVSRIFMSRIFSVPDLSWLYQLLSAR